MLSRVIVFLLCFGNAWMYISAAPAFAQVQVAIKLIDEETGQTTPAMVAIVSVADEILRLPPDGRIYAGQGSLLEDFYRGIAFSARKNWIGPVRKMAGYGNNNDRSYVYGLTPSVPYWKEPFAYQTSGDFSIRLGPGAYRIAVMRGNEYVPVREEFEVADGDSVIEKTILLKRWINLPEKGWYSGDVHVHHPTNKHEFREYLVHYAIAEDLHVVNVLAMGHHEGVEFDQAGFGKAYRVLRDDYVLVSGQEDPRSTFGHIIGLNINKMVRDTSQYDLYDVTFKGIHEQGGLVGQAHFAWNGVNMSRGFPWLVTTGMYDFVQLLEFRQLNNLDYYKYLNLGFKLTAAAGSDIPWGSTLGESRTFVYTGPEFNVDTWFDALEAGHTFVSNGPFLEFTIDGQLPGSEIQYARNAQAHVKVAVEGHPAVCRPQYVRVVGSDGLIQEFRPKKNSATGISGELTLTLERSQWAVASTICDNGATAHTTPIYLIVDGEPFYHTGQGPAIIDQQLASIGEIQADVQGWEDGHQKTEVLKRLDQAVRFYQALKQEMTAAQ